METKEQIIISNPEHDLLTKHLEVAILSDYNKKRLYDVLKNASVVNEDVMPADVVSIESYVMMGFRVGDVVHWEMPDGVKAMEILAVSATPLN